LNIKLETHKLVKSSTHDQISTIILKLRALGSYKLV